MRLQSGQRRWLVAIVLAGLVCAANGLVFAEPAAEPPLDPIAKQLKRIGALITNAGARLRNGVVGMDGPDGSAPSTAAQRCCSKNLERIEQSLVVLQQSLTERKACYEKAANPTAGATIEFAERDLEIFRVALNAFAAAPDDQVLPTLSALTRPYGDLRNGLQGLEACPASEPQGKKKRKKKS